MPMMMDHRLQGLYSGKPKVAFIVLFENPISNFILNVLPMLRSLRLIFIYRTGTHASYGYQQEFFSFPSIYMAVVQIKVCKSKKGHFW